MKLDFPVCKLRVRPPRNGPRKRAWPRYAELRFSRCERYSPESSGPLAVYITSGGPSTATGRSCVFVSGQTSRRKLEEPGEQRERVGQLDLKSFTLRNGRARQFAWRPKLRLWRQCASLKHSELENRRRLLRLLTTLTTAIDRVPLRVSLGIRRTIHCRGKWHSGWFTLSLFWNKSDDFY